MWLGVLQLPQSLASLRARFRKPWDLSTWSRWPWSGETLRHGACDGSNPHKWLGVTKPFHTVSYQWSMVSFVDLDGIIIPFLFWFSIDIHSPNSLCISGAKTWPWFWHSSPPVEPGFDALCIEAGLVEYLDAQRIQAIDGELGNHRRFEMRNGDILRESGIYVYICESIK